MTEPDDAARLLVQHLFERMPARETTPEPASTTTTTDGQALARSLFTTPDEETS